MDKRWISAGLIGIATAIMLGAFGAHALKQLTSDQNILQAFDTATKYQFLQSLGILIVPFILEKFSLKAKALFGLFIAGMTLFSGSIYLLTLAKINHLDWLKSIMGPLTPIGGALMITGWIILLIRFSKNK